MCRKWNGTYRILVGRTEGNVALESSKRRRKILIKRVFKREDIAFVCIDLDEDMVK